MTTAAVDEKKQKAEATAARNKEMDAREAKLNEGKTGKGKRTFLAMTRGKGTTEISYEGWDESKADTLPATLSEFMDLAGIQDEKEIIRRLILGDNEISYTEASDPIAEYVDASWDDKYATNFRTVVRNFSRDNGMSIEDAVNFLKPAMKPVLKK